MHRCYYCRVLLAVWVGRHVLCLCCSSSFESNGFDDFICSNENYNMALASFIITGSCASWAFISCVAVQPSSL